MGNDDSKPVPTTFRRGDSLEGRVVIPSTTDVPLKKSLEGASEIVSTAQTQPVESLPFAGGSTGGDKGGDKSD